MQNVLTREGKPGTGRLSSKILEVLTNHQKDRESLSLAGYKKVEVGIF